MPLKAKILAGEPIEQLRIPMSSSVEEVRAYLASSQTIDLLYIDGQHGPFTEWDVLRICKAAEEKDVPVNLRIKHTRHAYLIGNMLDLGPLAIKVPEVEDEATVHEAIDAFYFPPIGRRSWGGQVGYGIDARPDRLAYAQWWNQEGVLGFKIESLAAVLNIRALVKPGITFVDFGGQDLRFSMETTPHPTLTSVEECKEFVRQQLTGVPVRIL